jgi:hypothetical protein
MNTVTTVKTVNTLNILNILNTLNTLNNKRNIINIENECSTESIDIRNTINQAIANYVLINTYKQCKICKTIVDFFNFKPDRPSNVGFETVEYTYLLLF